MSFKSSTAQALFGLVYLSLNLNAGAAAISCPDPQVIRHGATTAMVTGWSVDSVGRFSAKLDGIAIDGRCSTTGAIEFSTNTNPKQSFSGSLMKTCGEPSYQGSVEINGKKETWYSLAQLKRATQTCTSKLPTIPDGHPTQADCVPTLKTEADVKRGQCLLRKLVWGPGDYPLEERPTKIDRDAESPFFFFFNAPEVEHWTLSQPFGFQSNIYFFKADHPNGKLAIFQQGHRKDYDACGGGDTIKFFLKNGYDVIALLMPAFGPNLAPTKHDPGNHNDVFTVTQDYNPLRLFLEPVVVSLNEALSRKAYSDVVMTGVSGGGWTTAWLAALEARITVAIPVAGSFPISDRAPRDMGDQEQYDFGTYTYVGYNDLYVIGAHKKKYLQISNAYDKCCFAAPNGTPAFVAQVKAAAAATGGSYDFAIDSSHRKHMISPWQLENLYTPLLGLKK